MGDVTSGHLKKANFENFHNHNFRITKPNYLLPSDLVVAKNHTVLFHNFDDIFNEQIKIWKEHNKRGGRPPQKANCVQEIVINIKPDTKLDDLQIIANYIKREYGYTPLEIAIHNDEGYVDKEGKPHFNHHAHIDFCTLKDGCQMARMEKYCDKVEYTKKDGTKSWKFQSNKDSKLQDFIAETLGMERGQKGSKAKRLEHEQYRQVAQQKQVLTDQIDDLNDINNLYGKLLQSYADSFEIKSGSAFEVLKEIGNKATELKELKADKEQQLEQIELLKKKRGVLNKGAKNYRQQKKALKQEISKLNNDITELNKTIQSLKAEKADLQNQEPKTETVTKLRDYSEQEKQDLIDNAIKAKIEQGDLFTKEQYDNKPLTQEQIKDYVEKNRQAMRQAGIYTASDYKQLSQLKADLISELKLAKSGELQLTNEQVKSRIATLMTTLSAKAKKAEDDLATAQNDLETKNKTIQSLTNENGVLKKLNDMLQKEPVNPAQKPKPKAEPILKPKSKPNLVGFENIGQKSSRTWESILGNTSTHESEVDNLKTQQISKSEQSEVKQSDKPHIVRR